MNKQVIISVLKIFLATCLTCSCKPDLYKIIDKYVKENCSHADTCSVFLKDITNFRWDKFYIIYMGQNVSEIIGRSYPYDTDLSEVIIFLKDGKIVYHKRILYHPEKMPKVTFSMRGNDYHVNDYKYMSFLSDEAHFYIRKIGYDKENYLMYPIVYNKLKCNK